MTIEKEGTRALEQQAEAESEVERLASLQELDRHLRDKVETLATLEREVAAMEVELATHREGVTAARVQRDARDRERRESEARLEDEESKMKDRRMRLNRVRNEKELGALRREIEVGKEANQQLETEVFALLQAVETLDAALVEREGALAAVEEKAATLLVGHRDRIAALTGEVDGERNARDRVANSLGTELRGKYEQILARRGATAVVSVRNGTCQGCHLHIPPQFFNELQKSRSIRLCPNCHRILIWRPEPPAEASRTAR